MKIFRNFSIKSKLIVVILLVTISALGIGFGVVIYKNIDTFKEEMITATSLQVSAIPVIALTAFTVKQEQAEGVVRYDGYLRKPVSKAELLAELMRFLPYSTKKPMDEEKKLWEEKEKSLVGRGTTGIESLTPGIKAKLPVLLTILSNELMDNWKKINDTFIIEDIKEFANIIREFGEKYKLDIFSGWGEQLLDQVKCFDMEKMPETLNQFPILIKKFENIVKKEENAY